MDEKLERQLEALTPAQRELFWKLRQSESTDRAVELLPLPNTSAPDSYALSFAQQRFWLLEQLHPGEPAHLLSGLLVLTGELRPEALQRAVDAVVERHAILRTAILEVASQPRATPQGDVRVALRIDDLRNLAPDDREDRRQQCVRSCTSEAFDLSKAPLLRAHLVRLADSEWQLIWCVHHIAADGLSMLHLVDDLERFYAAFATDNQPNAASSPPGYHDFAQWTAARDQAQEFAEGLSFFEQQLRDLPTTRLCADHDRITNEALGARLQQPVDQEVSAALLQLARAEGCTPFVTMLTGFVAALHRWTGDEDLVLGAPFANRGQPRLQSAVGLFVNSVVLRCRPGAAMPFRELLAHVREVVRSAFAFGDVPFERLVQHLVPERQLDRNPLFQVMFNFVDFADVDSQVGGMQWRYQEAPAGTLFDFTLYVRRHGDSFVLEAEYDQSRFEPETIAMRLHELHTLLQAVALDADTVLSRLPLRAGAPLARWERGAPLADGPDDAWSLVQKAVQGSHTAAIHDEQRVIEGAEVLEWVQRISTALRAAGVRPGDRVAFLLPRSRWLPIVALAIWHAGGVSVPLDPATPTARLSAVFAAANPTHCVTSHGDPTPESVGHPLSLQRLTQGPHRANAPEPVAANAPAYLLYTSGSTGNPKGVVVSHGALAAFLRAMLQSIPITAHDTLLAVTSPSFDIAWLEWLLPLCAGGRVHIATDDCVRDGTVLGRQLTQTQATFLQATPSTYRLLVAAGFRGNDTLQLLCGGEALADQLAGELRQRCKRLWNVYGPTETTIWSTVHEVSASPVRIGRAIPGTNVYVVDAHGQRMPQGCPGELCIGGAGLAIGYDALPEATAERFTTGPDGDRIYRTGDRVRFDTRGELQFLGRADEQVKIRGHRVEIGAVETWLAQHAEVAECAVHAVAGDHGVELVAHVVARGAARCDTGTDAWRAIWQKIYSDGESLDPELDHRGWHDSRTGAPLATDVMQRFVEHSAERIAALSGARVLEVGCGTGMLVAKLAAQCDHWLALDPTPAAVTAVQSLAQQRGFAQVTARQLGADQLDELADGSFDCVVIHSVAQYFPNLEYLLAVLTETRRLLAPGGTVFLGDVRLLPLHGAFVAWRELANSNELTSRSKFAACCDERIVHEPELLLDPSLFDELVAHGVFADCWIAARNGDDDTEMDRFRGDVVLTVDTRFDTPSALAAPTDNQRTASSWHAFELRNDATLATVADLRAAANRAANASQPLPTIDVSSRTACDRSTAPMPSVLQLRAYANTPHNLPSGFANQLRDHLANYLPLAVLPNRISWHTRLPRLPSGKVDRKQLLSSTMGHSAATFEAPRTATERQLATLFAEVLAVQRVGRRDDFFALGGHSLAAARLLARMREELVVDLSLRQVFATPVLRDLAHATDHQHASESSPLQARPTHAALQPGATMARLWFLQRLNPGSRAYLMMGVIDVVGPLQLDVFARALQDVVARHEILQLRIEEHLGRATLQQAGSRDLLRDLVDEATFAHTLDTMTGDDMVPLQVLHVSLSPTTRRFAFVLHHAFADSWSLAVLRRDLAHAYAARHHNRAPDWAPPPLQYLDFAHWQTTQTHDEDRAFWQQELSGAPPILDLPTERPRPEDLRECGERLEVQLDQDVLNAAAALARQKGATTFLVLLAAYQLWLQRISGQRDLVVGTTVANRDHPGLEDAIGCFLQTLPMRARVSESMSFAELLAQTKQTFLRCTEHQTLPFQELVEAVHQPRTLNRTPIFQATFDWLNHPTDTPAMADVEVFERQHATNTSKFEVSLVVTGVEPFGAYLEYRSDLFATTTMQSWWHAFEVLLRRAVATPLLPVEQLPWLDPPHQHELLALGRGASQQWQHPDVLTAWHEQVQATPERTAIRCGDEAWTFGKAHARVLSIAATLQQHGATPGQRIAICLPRSGEQLLAMIAILQIGCAYVAIDDDQPASRAVNMLRQAGVTLCLCASADSPPIAATACREPSVRWCSVHAAGDVPEPVQRSANDLAYVLFTSGSTGEPKGVAVSHRALANYVFWAREHYGHPRSAPVHTQLGFDLTLTSIWPVLLSGGTVHIPTARHTTNLEPLRELADAAPYALAKLTPSHLAAWQATAPGRPLADSLVLGGEALHLELLQALLTSGDVRVWNEYGPTEATVGCASREITNADPTSGPASMGRAIANTRLYVLDAQGHLVPRGVIGELCIAGDSLADGYIGRAELTAERFVDDPFVAGERMYRSGDFASWSAAGELNYHGRSDQQYKLRGHRIELGEVRACILQHPDVRDVAVTVQNAPSGSAQLLAYLVVRSEESIAEVRSHLAAALPPYAVPSHLIAVASLPFDRNGKLDPKQLPSPWQPREALRTPSHDEQTGALLQIASELLHVPDLAVGDDFFEAGGDSILALQLVARAADVGLAFEIRDVFAHPTVAQLRQVAQQPEPVPDAPDVGPLLPMQQWFFDQDFANAQHYDQAIWLTCHGPVVEAELWRALATLVARHHGLRTRFVRTAAGVTQEVLPESSWQQTALDLREFDGEDRNQALQQLTDSSNFAPHLGRCFAATLVRVDAQTTWLYLRAHHLVVDAVSWRLLCSELAVLLTGGALPPTPTSPIAHSLHARSQDRAASQPGVDPADCVGAIDSGSEGQEAIRGVMLAAGEFAALRAARAGRHRVEPLELLLAATTRAVPNPEGRGNCAIDVEGHGRNQHYAAGVARTVGWFTSVQTIVLPTHAAPATLLRLSKEQVRGRAQLAVANDAGGFKAPALVNYLGSIYADDPANGAIHILDRDPGQLRDPRNQRSHAYEVRAVDRNGELHATCHAPDARSAELFAQAFGRELRAMLAACEQTPAEPSYVDYPLATLTTAQTTALLGDRRDVRNLYPLTPTQQGMLFSALEQPDTPVYREQMAVVLEGPLRPDAIEAAFENVTARHELLRGEVHWRGLREPHWVIRADAAVSVTHATLARQGTETEHESVQRRLEELRQARFAFASDPLLRIELAQLAPQRHALMVTYHHVVLDGWSMPLLLRELVHCYRRHCGEALADLPPAQPFADHVAFLKQKQPAPMRAFWRERLQGFRDPLLLRGDLDGDYTNSSERSYSECERWLTAATTAGLRTQRRITTNTVVQTAWAVLLARWSGQSDVLFGVTVAGRPTELTSVERRIGLFINTLPLRIEIEELASVAQMLGRVQDTMLAMFAHQHTPLPLSQAQTDVAAGTDPFESLLVFENYPLAAAMKDLPQGLRVASTTAFERTSYALTLVVIPGERLCLRLLYQQNRYSSAFAEQLLAMLERLLQQFAEARVEQVRQLEWLPDPVRQRLTECAIAASSQPHQLVLDRVLAMARTRPDATAVIESRPDGETRITYGQLRDDAERIARDLLLQGASKDSLVAFSGRRDGKAIATLLGIWWSGAAYLPLDPDWPVQQVKDILAACKPTVVIPAHDAAATAENASPVPVPSEPSSLAYAVATSGTTGQPKVVLVEHASLANYVDAALTEFALHEDDRVLQFASFAFDTAAEEIWPTLCAGATLVLRREEQSSSSLAFVRACREQRTTVWDLPTAFFHQLASQPHKLPDELRLCIVGGQAAEQHAVQAFLAMADSVRLLNTYGPSEATIVATWCTLHDGMHGTPPIGKPVPGTEAWVLDAQQRPMPLGMAGELCLAGAGLARGYLDATATAARFITTPEARRLFRTGDLARLRDDGHLEFLGRMDRQVKISGVRVEPEAIETLLLQHSEVTDACVRVFGDASATVRLIAFVETHDATLDPSTLRHYLRSRLPTAAIPQQIVTTTQMPRLVSGKVDAEALRPPEPEPKTARPTGDPDVAAIQHIFAGLFGHDVAPDDDFFGLGGTSLVAVRLADAVLGHFDVDLSIEALFADPCPLGIAAAVRSPMLVAATASSEQMRRDAELPVDFEVVANANNTAATHVLLTGATGFFGRHVLRELLQADTQSISCLVRANDASAARQRIAQVLADTETSGNDRVQVLCGDVAADNFGLTPAQHQQLARQATMVVHIAAAVDFLRPYAQLRVANVIGTRNVLQFCARHGLPLHHVSSVGVFSDRRAGRLALIDESTDLAQFDRPLGGYAQSKWVSERLVKQAMARGLRAAIYRPGRLVADTRLGRSNAQDFVTALLKLCRDTQRIVALPGMQGAHIDLTPVDHAARELVLLCNTLESIGETFHLVHSEPPSIAELLGHWRAAGWTLRPTAWPQFRSTALQFLSANPSHPAAGLLPFLRAANILSPGTEPRFGNARTTAMLGPNAPRCPAIDQPLVKLWAEHLGE